MRVGGYHPLTLLDFPGRIATILFTQGCPFRCGYCHNPELLPVVEGAFDWSGVFRDIALHRDMLDGVVITGGEPTIHADLPERLQEIRRLGLLVKLDTNGVHPRVVQRLLAERTVDFFAMDIKHRFSRYREIVGDAPEVVLANCQETLQIIQESGVAHEFRTTVSPAHHTVDDLVAIAQLLRCGETYALQHVRYGKMLDPKFSRAPAMDLAVVQQRCAQEAPGIRVIVRT